MELKNARITYIRIIEVVCFEIFKGPEILFELQKVRITEIRMIAVLCLEILKGFYVRISKSSKYTSSN